MPVLDADPVEFRWPAAAIDEEDGADVDSGSPAAGEDEGASASASVSAFDPKRYPFNNSMTMLLRVPYFGTMTTMKTKRDSNGKMNDKN